MIVIALLVLTVALVLPLLLVLLRRWMIADKETEAWIRSPETHRLLYDVPNGTDPATISAALAQAGFLSVLEDESGTERLVIACQKEDESRARGVIDHVVAGS